MSTNGRKGKAGRRLKAATAVFFLFGLLIGCTNTDIDAGITERAEPQKDEWTNFETEDGKVEFVVQNKGEFSAGTLKEIKEEIVGFYGALQKEKIPISPPSKIYLNLHNEQKVSFHNGGTINLYYVSEGNYPLIHEMTHALFKDEKGQVTQEGLAIYMQDTYSERSVNPNYQEDTHEITKHLMSKEIMLPLETLLQDDRFFSYINFDKDSSSLRWLAYIESASFTRYLIDEYGLEKFLEIHGDPDLTTTVRYVYGKSLEQLEGEWKQFLQSDPLPDEEAVGSYDTGVQGVMKHLDENKERLLGG
ncbi:hypothetical protein ACQCVH_23500 [Bacillus infantis]|uniref:hypothetical protein n=1 Tax=Bacillus infantis TaxID=324767 RepID=UPI003CF50661